MTGEPTRKRAMPTQDELDASLVREYGKIILHGNAANFPPASGQHLIDVADRLSARERRAVADARVADLARKLDLAETVKDYRRSGEERIENATSNAARLRGMGYAREADTCERIAQEERATLADCDAFLAALADSDRPGAAGGEKADG